MSILPLEFHSDETSASLNLTGKEIYSIEYDISNSENLATIKVKRIFLCFFSNELI